MAKPTETAKAIKDLRDRRGWTQRQLANEMGVSIESVQAWEQSRRLPGGLARRMLTILSRMRLHD